MMGHKHLHELLKEDQEPFQLNNFIADRRCRLKLTRTTSTDAGKTTIQPRKRKSIVESSSSAATRNFCIKHACLFSFQDSPDSRKSPFLDCQSKETKSSCNNKTPHNAAVFLHIPARTAAMLLAAATRVQKQSASSKPKSGSSKNIGFGLFGSFLKRLKDRSNRTKSVEIGPINATASSPPARRSRNKVVNGAVSAMEVTGSAYEKRLSCSCNNSRLSSADWSDKSSDLETSCSSRSIHESEEVEFVGLERKDDAFASCEKCFCSSPSSPFHFSLQRSPSPCRRKPDSISPMTSPSRHFQEGKESCEGECSQEIHGDGEVEKEKEQCSPVSVLDPPFEDDDDGGAVEEDGYDIECNYASVQRAKHQLLQKLRRFERLAELDPIELEKHMLEQCYSGDEEEDDDIPYEKEATNEEFLREIVSHLGVQKIPWYMKRLVSDLIAEENKNEEHQVVVERVCQRLHSWKVVELNTIDMMVKMDFTNEGWKTYDEERVRETGVDIEVAIFGFLVDELAQELLNSSGP